MFVPDFLHEFELGVWKSFFTHMMRILQAVGDNCLQRLNWRYVLHFILFPFSMVTEKSLALTDTAGSPPLDAALSAASIATRRI